MSTAIEFENISKQYHLGLVSTGMLSHDLNRLWQTKVLRRDDPYLKVGETNDRTHKGNSDYVWALKDINFKVEQGDVVGIIGRNGAGKSTLLKLLSRVTAPTTGIIRAKGRIASLLEVGTGFHPEMTGRENIYMNGSIMGMTRAEITRKLDEIVAFSGCERYLDTPVKRYSSGMTVRLGFAIAAHLEPEILVVDEVLAVGDAEFQKKAIGKMQDVSRGEGRTVLFVSHNMGAVKNLCKRGIVLDQGKVVFDGGAEEAVGFYTNSNHQKSSKKIVDNIEWEKSFINIESIKINGSEEPQTIIEETQPYLSIEVSGTLTEPIVCGVCLKFKNEQDVTLATFAEHGYKGAHISLAIGKFSIEQKISLPRYLCRGEYFIDLLLNQARTQEYFFAPHCCRIYIKGRADQFGNPLTAKNDGFFGLESYEV